jgi:DNA-binding MarR family transcriptional regulator
MGERKNAGADAKRCAQREAAVAPGDASGTNEFSLSSLVYGRPGYLISRLHQLAVSVFHEEMAEFDITPKQYGTLVAIGACPGLDQAGVANRIGNDRATTGGVVDRLSSRGLIVRTNDPVDRRARKLHLTAEGAQLINDARPAMHKVQQRMLEPFSQEEGEAFVNMMTRLVLHHNSSSRVPMTDDAYPQTRGDESTRGEGSR